MTFTWNNSSELCLPASFKCSNSAFGSCWRHPHKCPSVQSVSCYAFCCQRLLNSIFHCQLVRARSVGLDETPKTAHKYATRICHKLLAATSFYMATDKQSAHTHIRLPLATQLDIHWQKLRERQRGVVSWERAAYLHAVHVHKHLSYFQKQKYTDYHNNDVELVKSCCCCIENVY